MLEEILFLTLALFSIVTAGMMILQKNPIYSVLMLILTLFALAGMYVLLNAPFVAAVHVIVYAGAIMVLFLFVIMLLDMRSDAERINLKRFSRLVAVAAIIVFVVESIVLITGSFTGGSAGVDIGSGVTQVGDTAAIGRLLFSKYLLPFEIASVLLLAAIIGAVVLAKREVNVS